MQLDLREIIELPGGKVLFDIEPDLSRAIGVSIVRIEKPVHAAGRVENKAGRLILSCSLEGSCICICPRCLKEFEHPIDREITANITESGAGEDPDAYLLQGNEIDITDIIVTEFILNTDERLLCNEDCAGLCHRCGADLNKGPCGCKKETDPRLAVLKQLLD